ncbi:S-adenosyl-L-methionine-dependent methyltransferase [Chaetomium sp. MPI-SDFR-AT-0129]|nr:S-adenosyl-L-methionine-dependent methyltransferase [Chaetomium sp. MPI-SDFR-AT-0129]
MPPPQPPSATSSHTSDSDTDNNDENWLTQPGAEDDDEDREESVPVVSLLDDQVFPDAASMLAHCREKHGFDFLAVRDGLGLDFLGCVRLINLVRRSTKEGKKLPEKITAEDLADDALLIPVLEDDALIFCLDDLPELGQSEQAAAPVTATAGADGKAPQSGDTPAVEDLLEKNAQLQAELEQLAKQFGNYRAAVEQTLDKRWGVDEEGKDDKAAPTSAGAAAGTGEKKQHDASAYYFESYDHNDIHETMIKDTVRTNAYRDFIYANKPLFAGKTVLDIGCGTGILSMFCARAGAARVVAVDNSAILDRARENVFRNGLDNIITCVRGRIEEVTLPITQFDIIVSEWMGYCLLYEAMLPSVFFARDRYLAPGGLLVPSHTSMWIAPVADSEYVADNIDWWRDVYGFDMQAMQTGIHTETRMTVMPASAVCGSAHAFRMLDLHTAKVEDLTFEDPWQTTFSGAAGDDGSKSDADPAVLDGFLVWFDCFFAETREEVVETQLTAKEWASRGTERVAFTTGPFDTATHWRQGLYLIDKKKQKEKKKDKATEIEVRPGAKLAGKIRYATAEGHERGLDIRLTWGLEGEGESEELEQTWLLH